MQGGSNPIWKWIVVAFQIFFVLKYIKMMFLYLLKIIFDINTSKRFKKYKKKKFSKKKILRTRFVPLRNCLGTRCKPRSQNMQKKKIIKI
jgi:hypothetical protein